MLFGFKAMDKLKVSKMKRTALSSAYAEFFNRLPQDWNSTYVSKDDEELDLFDDNLKVAVVVSGLILLMPLALILSLTLS